MSSLAAGGSRDDDDEFEFLNQSGAASDTSGPGPAKAAAPPSAKREEAKAAAKTAVTNQPYDEAEEVTDEEESQASAGDGSPHGRVHRPSAPVAGGASKSAAAAPAPAPKRADDDKKAASLTSPSSAASVAAARAEDPKRPAAPSGIPAVGGGDPAEAKAEEKKAKKEHKKKSAKEFGDGSGESASSGEEEEEEEEAGTAAKPSQAKLYNPAEYKHLSVSPEINDLFAHIGRYKPQDIELDTKLKPFIPDYIPAVGDIDAFIKVPPPAPKGVEPPKDGLGLEKLDEPAAIQTDPGVLEMKIRVFSKSTGLRPVTVRNIEHADKNPKKITTWINSIDELHRKKPAPTVQYSKNMPEIDALMQAWPPEFEQLLKTTPLPSADLNLDLAQYARVICALMDIPVYDKITESLHHLFSLYAEFKVNAHFQHASSS